jgi:hypothetical protein
MAMEGPDGRFLSASTFAAKIASAENLNGSKNRSGYAGSKILDALIPATPDASAVSSTQYIYLSLDNPSLHFSKHGLAFLHIQADLFQPDSGCRPLHTGYQLPFQHAAVEARFDPNSKLHRNLPAPIRSTGKRLPESTTHSLPTPTLIQSRDNLFGRLRFGGRGKESSVAGIVRGGVAGRNETVTKPKAGERPVSAQTLRRKREDASIKPLRRFLSILLLAVFGLPFVSPLLAMTAKSESNLPACCRKSGKHHCATSLGERTQLADKAPVFGAPVERCPHCPAAIAIIHGDIFGPPSAQAIFAGLIAHPAVSAQIESKLRISRNRSRQKRGPPATLSL